jgi:hypothetical protein
LCVEGSGRRSVWDLVLVKNISAGGLLFPYDSEIPSGSILDLKINFSLNRPPLLCTGQVLRCLSKCHPPAYEIAVRFLTLKQAEADLIEEQAEKFYAV